MIIQAVLDLMLFKLAFHTYEALANKEKMRKIRRKGADIDDKTTDIDLISNLSGESTITMGGPAGPQKEKKMDAYDVSLDVKLNKYLMKWIVIIIFYQIQWIFGILGVILPGMPLVKICLSFWITLPQFRGEFFIYEALAEYILKMERVLLEYRSRFCSHVIRFFANISAGSLKSMIAFASEEAILKTQDQCKEVLEVIHCEILCRCDNSGKPLPKAMQRELNSPDQRLDIDDFTINLDDTKGGPQEKERDTYIRNQQSNQRLKLNQTMDFSNMDSIDFNQTITTPQHSAKKLGAQGFYESHIRDVPQTNANRYMERDMFNDDISLGRSMMSHTQVNPMTMSQLDINRQMTAQDQDRLFLQEQQMARLRQQQRFQQQQAMNQSMYVQMPQQRLETEYVEYERERDLQYARQNMREDASMRLQPRENFEMVEKDNISQKVKPTTGKTSNPLTERRKQTTGVSSSAAKPTTSNTGLKKTVVKGNTSKR